MEEKTIHIPNISCGHCVATIRREVGELDGVREVTADQATKTVTVKWQSPATWQAVDDLLTEIGYPPER